MGAAPRHPIPPGDCRCWRTAATTGIGQGVRYRWGSACLVRPVRPVRRWECPARTPRSAALCHAILHSYSGSLTTWRDS